MAFRLVPLPTPSVHINPPNEGGGLKWGESKLHIGIAAKRRQIEQHFYSDYWEVVGGLLIGANPNPLTLPLPPKLEISKLPF